MLTHGISSDFGGGVHSIIPPTPSGQSRVYRDKQLRTYGVHCPESAGTGPVLKVLPVTGAAFEGHHGPIHVRLSFPTPTISMLNEVGMLKVSEAVRVHQKSWFC